MNDTVTFDQGTKDPNATSTNGTLIVSSDVSDLFWQPDPFLIALYIPVFLVSIVSNALLIFVAVKCNYIKSITNIFLVNLSVADLLVTTICMPIQLSKAVTIVWFYGDTVCKMFNYLQGVAVASSVFTLTAMSVDRWLSITAEPRLRPPGKKQALVLIAFIWIAALGIFLPVLIVATVEEEMFPTMLMANGSIEIGSERLCFCIEGWSGPRTRQQFGTFSFTMIYAVPGTITILSYVCMGRTLCSVRPPFDVDEGNLGMQQGLRLMKERRRVAWILLLLAVIFAACWLPYNIMQLLLDTGTVEAEKLSSFLPYALLLGHTNSAINPIVYCLMTRNFQRSAQKLLCGRSVCKQVAFTWRCTQKPEGSSSDYDLYHEPHKRCYLPMNTLRCGNHFHAHGLIQNGAGSGNGARSGFRAKPTQVTSNVTRSSRRTAPAHTLSVEMLQRHAVYEFKR